MKMAFGQLHYPYWFGPEGMESGLRAPYDLSAAAPYIDDGESINSGGHVVAD